MNKRRVKLELTTELINQKEQHNVLEAIQQFMRTLRDEAGRFIKMITVKKEDLGRMISKKTYALQYENCTVDVELILNAGTKSQDLYRFDLR